jgi:hypothetical protein
MELNPAFLLEFGLFSGGAVVWSLWELWSLRRGETKSGPDASPPSKRSADHSER